MLSYITLVSSVSREIYLICISSSVVEISLNIIFILIKYSIVTPPRTVRERSTEPWDVYGLRLCYLRILVDK